MAEVVLTYIEGEIGKERRAGIGASPHYQMVMPRGQEGANYGKKTETYI